MKTCNELLELHELFVDFHDMESLDTITIIKGGVYHVLVFVTSLGRARRVWGGFSEWEGFFDFWVGD
jgi:hypothetical protein